MAHRIMSHVRQIWIEIKVLSVLKINEMDKFLPLLLEMVRWENTVEEGVDKLTKGMVVANTEGAS